MTDKYLLAHIVLGMTKGMAKQAKQAGDMHNYAELMDEYRQDKKELATLERKEQRERIREQRARLMALGINAPTMISLGK